ncbi:MAG: glycosyltransferase family 9 protein [Leptospirales bacterium]
MIVQRDPGCRTRSVLVVALTRMGDLYELYPMVAALKERDPDCRIFLAVYREFVGVLGPLDLFSGIFPVDAQSLRCRILSGDNPLESYQTLNGWLSEVNGLDLDLLINLTPNRIGAVLGYLIQARDKRGLHMTADGFRAHYGVWVPYLSTLVRNRLYNSLNLSDLFLKIAGVNAPGSISPLIADQARNTVLGRLQKEGVGINDSILSFATGASVELKRWPVRSFAHVIRRLLSEDSSRVIVLLGSGESDLGRNRKISEEVGSAELSISSRLLDWTGRTSVDELFSILSLSSILVSNDTGTMHAAALLKTPVVCLSFANLFYPETGPWASGNVVIHSLAPCAPCGSDSRCLNPVCREDLDPEVVASVVRTRMAFPGNPSDDALALLERSLRKIPVGIRSDIALARKDEGGDLRFRSLGRGEQVPEAFFRRVYERVWREDLEGKKEKSPPPLMTTGIDPDVFKQALFLEELALEGIDLVGSVRGMLGTSREESMETILTRLDEVDRSIERMSWVCPPLGPLVVFFRMEKESVDVWDPFELLKLVEQTEETYAGLCRRVRLFTSVLREWDACGRNLTQDSLVMDKVSPN